MHNFFTENIFSFGSMIVLMGGLWRLEVLGGKILKLTTQLLTEHEMLIRDYCERNNLHPNDLPSRLKTLW